MFLFVFGISAKGFASIKIPFLKIASKLEFPDVTPQIFSV
jgi:hypothetical protein